MPFEHVGAFLSSCTRVLSRVFTCASRLGLKRVSDLTTLLDLQAGMNQQVKKMGWKLCSVLAYELLVKFPVRQTLQFSPASVLSW